MELYRLVLEIWDAIREYHYAALANLGRNDEDSYNKKREACRMAGQMEKDLVDLQNLNFVLPEKIIKGANKYHKAVMGAMVTIQQYSPGNITHVKDMRDYLMKPALELKTLIGEGFANAMPLEYAPEWQEILDEGKAP